MDHRQRSAPGLRATIHGLRPAVQWSASLAGALLALLLGVALVALAYQVPAWHEIDLGGYDAGYIQGFHDVERTGVASASQTALQGSDGSARWSRGSSALIFPQAGLPGSVTLRLRGWRPAGPPPRLTLLLNGREELASFVTSGEWQEYTLRIDSGLLKANDFFLELRADTTRLPNDQRELGVLLDRVSYSVGPGWITPYPAQLAYGGLAAMLLWLLSGERRAQSAGQRVLLVFFLLPLVLLCCCFAFGYRRPPPLYPYPIWWLLPGANGALATALGLRAWRRLGLQQWVQERPALIDALAAAAVALWVAALLAAQQGHLTLSRPGVESDFRVFATRDTLARVLSADGFYNLGYPLLLWLIRPLTQQNAFLAARLIAAVSAGLLLGATYWLAREVLGGARQRQGQHSAAASRAMALLAMVITALSPLVVQYGLYVGSDMPFAALVTLTMVLLARSSSTSGPGRRLLFAAGLVAGAAFLVRHLALVLLPWGVLHCALASRFARQEPGAASLRWRALAFVVGFLLAAGPQLAVNSWQTGQPLYNQQAKNVWLGVYGNGDWERWDQAPNNVSLGDVVLGDPGRFFGNWGYQIRSFLGTGAEDSSEFGRAWQLRLLGWPANWLALLFFGWWLLKGRSLSGELDTGDQGPRHIGSLLIFVGLYMLAVCMAFALPRYFLPLVPIYGLAAAAGFRGIIERWQGRKVFGAGWGPALAIALVLFLWPGFGTGVSYVIDHQPGDELAMATLVSSSLRPNDRLFVRLPPDEPLGKYSVIAHYVTPWPGGTDDAAEYAAALLQARSSGSPQYLLWADDPKVALPPDLTLLRRTGEFALYRIN